MSHVHRRTRLPLERARVAKPSDNKVLFGYAFFGLLAFIGVMVAIAADEPGLRLMMAGAAVFAVLALFFLSVLQRGQARGFIGHASKGTLTFRPVFAFFGLQLAMAVVGIATALGVLVVDPSMLRGQGSIWIGTFGVGSVIWLTMQLFSLRLPAGLRITEDGLTGVRGVGPRTFSWDEIVDVTPEIEGREVALGLTDVHGLITNVGASSYLGSDPALVAQVVNHFLDHPEDRHLLSDPSAAIRRVEQAAQAAELGESTPEPSALVAPSLAVPAESATLQQEPLDRELKDAPAAEPAASARGWGKWPPARGWWWRWPLLVVVAFSWLAVLLGASLLMSGDDTWIGILFYLAIAVGGTWLLRWHRGVRNRDS